MGGIGIVNNPRSRRNQRAPETARTLRQLLDGEGEVADATTRDELARVVERFRARGIDVLGVNGGDGTAHYVVSAFAQAYAGAPLPALALLRGGTMNTVAHGNGIRGTPEAILRRLLERRRAGLPLRAVDRDLLAVSADGGTPRFGFLFGTGATVAFLDAYYRSGDPRPSSAARLIAAAFASAVTGGPLSQSLTARERLRVVADGDDWPDEPYLGLLAASVPEIGFGFRAFARCDEQPGFFHAVGVIGSVLQLALALPRIYLGKPWRRSVAVDGVVRDLRIDGPLRFTVDGDLYDAREELRVRTGPPVRLLQP